MKAEDFIGLPVINRIPGERYGEKVGEVTDARVDDVGLYVEMSVGRAEWAAITLPLEGFSYDPT